MKLDVDSEQPIYTSERIRFPTLLHQSAPLSDYQSTLCALRLCGPDFTMYTDVDRSFSPAHAIACLPMHGTLYPVTDGKSPNHVPNRPILRLLHDCLCQPDIRKRSVSRFFLQLHGVWKQTTYCGSMSMAQGSSNPPGVGHMA